LQKEIEKYLKEILQDKKILGISFYFKNNSKLLLKFNFGTPTVDTSEFIEVVFLNKKSISPIKENLQYYHEYFLIKNSAECVLSYVCNKSTISDIELNHIISHLKLLIKEFYLNKQKDKLQKDLYRLWDIIDGTVKHYVNNELFSLLGKIDIIRASGNIDKLVDIKAGINSLITNIEKIFNEKSTVLCDTGIKESKNYYKDNFIIKID